MHSVEEKYSNCKNREKLYQNLKSISIYNYMYICVFNVYDLSIKLCMLSVWYLNPLNSENQHPPQKKGLPTYIHIYMYTCLSMYGMYGSIQSCPVEERSTIR